MTSDPRIQPAEVCETQHTLGTSLSYTAFFIFLTLSCKMTWTRFLSISHVQHLLGCLFYMLCSMRPTKLVCIPACCNSKVESVKYNAKMVGHTGDSKTPGDEENPDPLPWRWAGYPEHFWSCRCLEDKLAFLLKVSASVCCIGVFACTLE